MAGLHQEWRCTDAHELMGLCTDARMHCLACTAWPWTSLHASPWQGSTHGAAALRVRPHAAHARLLRIMHAYGGATRPRASPAPQQHVAALEMHCTAQSHRAHACHTHNHAATHRNVLSLEPDTRVAPSALSATQVTSLVCPSSVRVHSPVVIDHTLRAEEHRQGSA
jgi:hypothetical protein